LRAACLAGAGVLALALAVRAQGSAPATPPPAPTTGAPPAAATPPATVKIVITTAPTQKKVFVFWGKKRLGMLAPHQPLVVQRPRDSGPLDLIITCEGYVPVQTRAYTFADSKLAVRLTPLDQKNTLLGYREEVPPPPPPTPDAGTPPPAPGGAAAPPPGVAAPPPDAGAR
jgi:hypothetical protein